MKIAAFFLSLLLALVAFWPAAGAAPDGSTQVAEQRRNPLREAVEAHRAERREEVRREEAAVGRHLSPAELAELREQVRQQWAPRAGRMASAETQPSERVMPAPVAAPQPQAQAAGSSSVLSRWLPAARSQRP